MTSVQHSPEPEGLIFNIQRFCVHDGPGIRTTIFMKGCPLNCRWCANPESISPHPVLITRDIKCSACGKCVDVCPAGAITFNAEQGRVINWQACTGCLDCVEVCLYGALGRSGRMITLEEAVNELLKDAPFYRRSGGGITISGGEPLNQPRFVSRLLTELHEQGLHTALDTSGHAPADVFSNIIEQADLVLLDIKHLDSDLHREYTGVGNEKILANASYAAGRKPVWFRIPVIPGFNDNPDHIGRIAELASSLGVEKISLLPYHQGGQSKSLQIGREYKMPDLAPPSPEHISVLQDVVSRAGVNVTVQK